MHISHAASSVSLVLFLLQSVVSQSSPAFCSRLYHSVVVANNQLYVDGGELRTLLNGNLSVAIPETVDTIDLTKPFTTSDTTIWGHIPKNGTDPASTAPTLNDGSIFATSSSLYLFGGAISAAPGAPTVPPPNGIWQYGFHDNLWGQAATGGDSVQRIHWGQAAQAVDSSVGYFLGGAMTPKSDPFFNTLPGARPYMVQGLITIAEESMDLANTSTVGLNQDGTTFGGFLALIESLGSAGVIVAFGGITNVEGAPMQLDDADLADPFLHSPLTNISIYDIGTEQWYQQAATGDIPPWRYNGCSVVVSAPDNSSHSIYVFGGWGNTFAGSDGNVYVLSLPSFRWIRVNEDSDRRSRLQCNLVGKHTMLVVGGTKPNEEQMQPFDATGCDTSPMFAQGLGLFSLNNHTWAASFDPTEGSAAYQVHPNISQVIGGNENGSATNQSPVGGFSQQALETLLGARQVSNTTSNAASPGIDSSNKPSNGSSGRSGFSDAVIAGIAVAAGACFILIILIILYLSRRCHHQRKPVRPMISPPVLQFRKASEMDASNSPIELGDDRVAAYELASTEKPLPPRPHDKKSVEMFEAEAELGIHPAERGSVERDQKEKIAEHRYASRILSGLA